MTRGTSPILLGRDADLGRLRSAIAAMRTGASGIVLVSGEAGIGKSRLLADWEAATLADARSGRPVRFLHAACIESGERLAFLPVLDWLDELLDGDRDVAEAAAALKAAFGGFEPAGSETEPSDSPRAARFSGLRDLLVRAAQDGDVVGIIDDLHWADRSTLDVVTFLARRLAKTGVLLVAAFRSDELHRRHPLTGPLADLERQSTLDHVRLEPLAPMDVARQVAAIQGDDGDRARSERAARIVELADGNPFHVEELVALERAGPLPSTLRDVLASRLAQVDDPTMAVLREAAVIGRRVDADLLITISRDDREAVQAALRSAADARILVTADDGRRVQFRHALLREAVYDEVLASERAELHRRIALGLTRRPDLGDPSPATAAAELARHWLAAGAWPEAFSALVAAARMSASAVAWAEARWALEEALGLWDRVPEPAALAGVPRHVALSEAAAYAWYEGDSRRAIELNHQAQREPAVNGDPERLGSLLTRESWYQGDVGDAAASRAAIERAVATIPTDPPSAARALAVGTFGAQLASRGRVIESMAWLEDGARMAAGLGDIMESAADLSFLACAYATVGRETDAIETISNVPAMLEAGGDRSGMDDAFFAFSSNEPWVWLELGYEEATIESIGRHFVEARERGVETSIGPWLIAPMAVAQFRSGRWDEALATAESAALYGPSLGPIALTHSIRASILAGRGSFSDARSAAARAADTVRAGWLDEEVISRSASVWTELLAGDPNAAAAVLAPAIDLLPTDELTTWRAELAWLAAWTAVDGATRPDADPAMTDRYDRLAAFARHVVAVTPSAGAASHRAGHVGAIERWQRMAAAEIDRGERRDSPESWSTLAEMLEGTGSTPLAMVARLREAAARISSGESRETTRTALARALALADRMAATGLRDRVLEMARAARIDLGATDGPAAATTVDPPAADPWGLSRREREVLGLLADGRTNAQIGAALYISDKTASVHVTHILDKLGVDSRIEAALLAVRAGFVPPAETVD